MLSILMHSDISTVCEIAKCSNMITYKDCEIEFRIDVKM